jgi:hypothetical protein
MNVFVPNAFRSFIKVSVEGFQLVDRQGVFLYANLPKKRGWWTIKLNVLIIVH